MQGDAIGRADGDTRAAVGTMIIIDHDEGTNLRFCRHSHLHLHNRVLSGLLSGEGNRLHYNPTSNISCAALTALDAQSIIGSVSNRSPADAPQQKGRPAHAQR